MSRFRAPALIILFFFFNDTATTEIYTLSLHDALPIWQRPRPRGEEVHGRGEAGTRFGRPRPDQDRARQARGEGRRHLRRVPPHGRSGAARRPDSGRAGPATEPRAAVRRTGGGADPAHARPRRPGTALR